MSSEVLRALLNVLTALASERNQLAADLRLSSPARETHALVRDLSSVAISAIERELGIAAPDATPAVAGVAQPVA